MTACSVSNCTKKVASRGMCGAHWKRWHRHGNPIAGRTAAGEPMRFISKIVMAYEGDECLLWPFARTANGYAFVRVTDGYRVGSNLVCEEAHGPPPTSQHEAAHSCGRGDAGCVTKRHLRWATSSENKADIRIHRGAQHV